MNTALFFWLVLCGNLVLLLAIAGIFVRLACTRVVVQGESMMPTLAEGDALLVLDWWPRCLLARGQIVVSKLPHMSGGELYIKRIIAIAGETVSIPLAALPRRDIPQVPACYHDEHGLRTWQIPARHVFVRGDNAAQSIDSALRGPFPYERIQGVVLMKLPCTFLLFSRRKEDVSAR